MQHSLKMPFREQYLDQDWAGELLVETRHLAASPHLALKIWRKKNSRFFSRIALILISCELLATIIFESLPVTLRKVLLINRCRTVVRAKQNCQGAELKNRHILF